MDETGVLDALRPRRVAARAVWDDRRIGIVPGIAHRQRRENILAHKLFVWHAADFLDKVSQQEISGVAVVPLLARLKLERLIAESPDQLFRRRRERLELLVSGESGEAWNTGGVRQQVKDRHLVPSRWRIRHVFFYGIVYAEFPAL